MPAAVGGQGPAPAVAELELGDRTVPGIDERDILAVIGQVLTCAMAAFCFAVVAPCVQARARSLIRGVTAVISV